MWFLRLAALSGGFTALAIAQSADFFEARVRPVLAERCYGCHAAAETSGLRVDSRDRLLKGGKSGPAIVPGHPEQSLLIAAITHSHDRLHMPPNGKLSEAQAADIGEWIRAGAAWPEPKSASISAEKARSFWSFQPLVKSAPPAVKRASWPRGAIDRFVLARLEQKGVSPAGPAEPRALLRRVTFDLTGLPPAVEDASRFASAPGGDALAREVDRLLASPRFGEKWARHWLDVARFGEDDVRGLAQETYPNAWRYRDWVIDAYNRDLPYNEFVRAQFAADLLPQFRPEDRAALGLFGLGPWYYDLTVPTQARADERHDRVDMVTRGFLGVTVACARCHDHKFDPISMKDYYAIAGIFSSSEYHEYPLVPQDQVARFQKAKQHVKDLEDAIKEYSESFTARLAAILGHKTGHYLEAAWLVIGPAHADPAAAARQAKLDRETLERWVAYLREPMKEHPFLQPWQQLLARGGTEEEARQLAAATQARLDSILEEKKQIDEANAATRASISATVKKRSKTQLPNGFASYEDFCPGCQTAVQALDRDKWMFWNDLYGTRGKRAADDQKPRKPGSIYYYGEGEIERWLDGAWKEHLESLRAELDVAKKALPEQFPFQHGLAESESAANLQLHVRGSPFNLGEEVPRGFPVSLSAPGAKPFTKGSGRAELAEAIVSHPLAARVYVNRVWERIFGEGLVRTPSNFGQMGTRPSNQELLEYLAASFVENGWSTKKLLREIVLSAVYQMSSNASAAQLEADPDGRLLSRRIRRRLDAEAIRDTVLFVSGSLKNDTGGASVDLSKDRSRRTVYGKVSRFRLDSTLEMFDFPSPAASSEKRNLTVVPQQRLYFLNGDFILGEAAKLAERLQGAAAATEGRLRYAYRLLYSREARPEEIELGKRFLQSSGDSWTQLAQVLLTANELSYVD